MKLTAARLREVLIYFPETGEFVWRVGLSKRFAAGRRAGCLLPSGYRVIGIDGSLYSSHRLAWLYVHGVWPSAQLDHKNGIKNDNRIRNLRECSAVENSRNRAGGNMRRLGFKGVTLDKRSGRWRAQIDVDSKTICLGSFESTIEAAAAYDAAARRHHGAFAKTNGMFQWRRVRNSRASLRRRARSGVTRRGNGRKKGARAKRRARMLHNRWSGRSMKQG